MTIVLKMVQAGEGVRADGAHRGGWGSLARGRHTGGRSARVARTQAARGAPDGRTNRRPWTLCMCRCFSASACPRGTPARRPARPRATAGRGARADAAAADWPYRRAGAPPTTPSAAPDFCDGGRAAARGGHRPCGGAASGGGAAGAATDGAAVALPMVRSLAHAAAAQRFVPAAAPAVVWGALC